MKILYLLTMVTLLFTSGCKEKNTMQSENSKNDLKVMAYYVPSSELNENDIPFDHLTHVIFSFTHVINHEMKFADEQLGLKLDALNAAAKNHPEVKIMIACGGWGGSGGFSDMAASEKNRKIFVDSVIEFIKQYDLDGLDLDWEYPGLPGIGNTYRPEDKQNFSALVKELRIAMDSYKPGLIISFAAAGWTKYFDHIEITKVMKEVDYINLMTYDLAGGSPLTTHHTNLYSMAYEELSEEAKNYLRESNINYQPRSINDIVQFCLDQGIEASQMVIGGAFYGRSWEGVQATNNGFQQKHNNVKKAFKYAEIDQMLKNDSMNKRYWDETSKAPYLFNSATGMFITYDDPESLRLKTSFALDHQLGGIMFWQLSQDTKNNDLVKAIDQEKTKP